MVLMAVEVPIPTGVTTKRNPGSSGAYTQIVVAAGAPTLYYYCTNHSGMGGQANTDAGACIFWRPTGPDNSGYRSDCSSSSDRHKLDRGLWILLTSYASAMLMLM